jgi:hypothetical protein
MIKNKMALLGAAATLGVMGGAFVSPAQAIALQYNLANGIFASGGDLSGSFEYDIATNTYSAFNISSTSSAIAAQTGGDFTYTLNNSTLQTATSTGFTLISNLAPVTRLITFEFSSPLPSTVGGTANVIGYDPLFTTGSSERFVDAGLNQTTIAGFNSGATVTAVPWETDALSVIGVTTLFGFGVWNKRKRKVDLSK